MCTTATCAVRRPYGPDEHAVYRRQRDGPNKIIYGLSRVTFVVASDEGSGGTWAGAKEALDRQFAPVHGVLGPARVPRTEIELVQRGATSVTQLEQLFTILAPYARPADPVQPSLFN